MKGTQDQNSGGAAFRFTRLGNTAQTALQQLDFVPGVRDRDPQRHGFVRGPLRNVVKFIGNNQEQIKSRSPQRFFSPTLRTPRRMGHPLFGSPSLKTANSRTFHTGKEAATCPSLRRRNRKRKTTRE